MKSHYKYSMRSGFTLIELIIAISISVIVVGFMYMFLVTPVDNYMAQSRRSELAIESDLIHRLMMNDIRNAVPNSIRRQRSGSIEIVELLNAVDMVSYRKTGTSGVANNELDFAAADAQFSTLGRFNNAALPCCAAGYFLIVNQSQIIAGQNAYNGDRSITSATTNVTIQRPGPTAGSDFVRLTPAFQFALPSATAHVFLSNGPVAYVCDEAAHTLQRYQTYPIASGVAANRGSASTISMVSRDINTCNFSYTASTATRADLVSIKIQLQRNGETQFTMLQGAAGNLP
jgi:MSHA biogenesis protein MshO